MKKIEILQNNTWCEVYTRTRTPKGLRRMYNKWCRETARSINPICGIRIITVQNQHLGIVSNEEMKRWDLN